MGKDQSALACAYAAAAGRIGPQTVQKRLEEILEHVENVRDSFLDE